MEQAYASLGKDRSSKLTMGLQRIIMLVFRFLILANFLASVQSVCLNDNGNYTVNSTYASNLEAVLSSLYANLTSDGFYNASVGQNPDKANAAVLCRGDVDLDGCRRCLRKITTELLQSCPNQKQAVDWADECMLRYSNESMFGILQTDPGLWMWNPNNATSPAQFKEDLRTLIDDLRTKAVGGGGMRKFAAGNATAPDFQDIYSLLQCTPDLSPEDCNNCLVGAAADIPGCCDNKRGGRVLRPNCNLRFEIYPFFNQTRVQQLEPVPVPVPVPVPTPEPPVQSPPGKNDDNSSNRTGIIVAVSIVACVIIVAALLGMCLRNRMRRKPKENPQIEAVDETTTVESLQYDFSTMKTATNDFSDDNKLGQGGFGAVYKGKLPNNKEIAVKRLSRNSGQGDVEFKNEVLLLAKLQHRNLVKLLGFSIQGNEKLIVYEFVHNGSLDHFMLDPIKRSCLDWDRRYTIIKGIAKGLLYLHEDSQIRIIHRDLKPGNILLDREMNPKIADFGLARLFGQDETQGNTNMIAGTYGFMAPEYAVRGHFSVKSDVFSFGVLLLEIISGRKINSFRDGENIVEDLLIIAWRNWREGTSGNMVDPLLLGSGSGSMSDILRCIHIGLLCVQQNAADRPTMASVIIMLSSVSMSLAVPSEPSLYMVSDYESEYSSRDHDRYNTNNSHNINSNQPKINYGDTPVVQSDESSKNDVSITEFYPR